MRIYLNAGHDTVIASQMVTAMSHLAQWLESAWPWAVRNVRTVKSTPLKWEGVLALIITLHTPTTDCWCGERMELVPVNFHPRVVQLSLCQQSSSPRPQLNKNTDNAISNVSFQTVKARPSAKKNPQERDSDDETCEKGCASSPSSISLP